MKQTVLAGVTSRDGAGYRADSGRPDNRTDRKPATDIRRAKSIAPSNSKPQYPSLFLQYNLISFPTPDYFATPLDTLLLQFVEDI